jgi:hypothetical protein
LFSITDTIGDVMNISRRDLLSIIAATPALCFFSGGLAQGPNSDDYADHDLADRWMQEWMPLNAVSGALHIMRFSDGYYALTEEISWSPEKEDKPLRPVNVPYGFVTDFASIPRIFWTLLPRDGQYTYAAIVHDYLYWNQTTSREDADKVFRAVMYEFGVSAAHVTAIFAAVRAGGGVAWNRNSRARAAGELRILSCLPSDPKVKWQDWKSKPDVC